MVDTIINYIMGDCFSCLIDNTKNDLSSNNGLGIVKTQINVINVGTSIAHLNQEKGYKTIDDDV